MISYPTLLAPSKDARRSTQLLSARSGREPGDRARLDWDPKRTSATALKIGRGRVDSGRYVRSACHGAHCGEGPVLAMLALLRVAPLLPSPTLRAVAKVMPGRDGKAG
jgi:hypothetical protein